MTPVIIFKSDGKAYYVELPNEKEFSGDQWKENEAYKQALVNAIEVKDQEMAKRIVSGRRVDHPYLFSLKGWTVTKERHYYGEPDRDMYPDMHPDFFEAEKRWKEKQFKEFAVFTKTDTMEQKQDFARCSPTVCVVVVLLLTNGLAWLVSQ